MGGNDHWASHTGRPRLRRATQAGELMSQVVPLMERCVLPVALQCETTVVKEKGGSVSPPALLLPLSDNWDLMGATAVGCAGVFSALGPPERVSTSAVPCVSTQP